MKTSGVIRNGSRGLLKFCIVYSQEDGEITGLELKFFGSLMRHAECLLSSAHVEAQQHTHWASNHMQHTVEVAVIHLDE